MNPGGSGSDLPQFKKFETESEIEEKKRKRQEEWEKVRTEDQPLEAPEEEYDPRSLYDRLQEQKDKKQSEYEDQFKAKNQVRGLDNEEAQFLDFVSERSQEEEKKREQEDFEVIREYKKALVVKASDPTTSSRGSAAGANTSRGSQPSTSQGRKSQSALLMGAVKRKGSANEPESTEEKKTKVASPEKESGDQVDNTEESPSDVSSSNQLQTSSPTSVAKVIGILPGMGAYTDSSDSDSNSSESDVDVSMFKKHAKVVVCSHSSTSSR